MPGPDSLVYRADFWFPHRLKLELVMFDHREHRWHWTHLYRLQPEGMGSEPDIVNRMRVSVAYIDGALRLPLKVTMEIIIPSRLGKRFFAGMDLSPGAKTYVEFHYGDPDAERTLRLMRIEVGASRAVDLPRQPAEAGDAALVMPLADFPFPVLDRLPVTWGVFYRVPFLPEGDVPLVNGAPEWPTIDVRCGIAGGLAFAPPSELTG